MRKELIELIEKVGLGGKPVFAPFFQKMDEESCMMLEMMLHLTKILMPKGLIAKVIWEYAEDPEFSKINWVLDAVKESPEVIEGEVIVPQ